jgi:hypothetical protein
MKMDEEKIDNTEDNSDGGDLGEAKKLLADTNAAAERLEVANKKREELLAKEEAINAQSGSTQAGYRKPKEKDPYDDPVEYSKAVFSGKENPLI